MDPSPSVTQCHADDEFPPNSATDSGTQEIPHSREPNLEHFYPKVGDHSVHCVSRWQTLCWANKCLLLMTGSPLCEKGIFNLLTTEVSGDT